MISVSFSIKPSSEIASYTSPSISILPEGLKSVKTTPFFVIKAFCSVGTPIYPSSSFSSVLNAIFF